MNVLTQDPWNRNRDPRAISWVDFQATPVGEEFSVTPYFSQDPLKIAGTGINLTDTKGIGEFERLIREFYKQQINPATAEKKITWQYLLDKHLLTDEATGLLGHKGPAIAMPNVLFFILNPYKFPYSPVPLKFYLDTLRKVGMCTRQAFVFAHFYSSMFGSVAQLR